MTNKILDKYFAHYTRKVDKGISSPLSRIEAMSIGIFLGWMLEHYNITERKR